MTLALPSDEVQPAIIPGASMTVAARLSAGAAGAITLPPSAVSIGADGAQVMVYTPAEDGQSGTVDWQSVDVSSVNGTQINVTGIDPAALIVGAGIQMLRAGDTVRPFTGLSVE